uniref:Uncharacterized protein n=1 Tax=Romanomermis culicivorax TaxID=13658 RepID=A0A915K0X8_ROMCU
MSEDDTSIDLFSNLPQLMASVVKVNEDRTKHMEQRIKEVFILRTKDCLMTGPIMIITFQEALAFKHNIFKRKQRLTIFNQEAFHTPVV